MYNLNVQLLNAILCYTSTANKMYYYSRIKKNIFGLYHWFKIELCEKGHYLVKMLKFNSVIKWAMRV